MTVHDGPAPAFSEALEISERNLAIAGRLAGAAAAFFFVAFLFAFFYLRALNSNGRWNQHHLQPPWGLGIAILICVLVSVAVLAVWTMPSTATPGDRPWRLAGALALALGLAAIVLQIIEWKRLGFGPGDGGLAAVFLGWTGCFTVFALAAMYWLETLLVGARRGTTEPEYTAASARALTIFWGVLGLVQVAAFLLLYVVK